MFYKTHHIINFLILLIDFNISESNVLSSYVDRSLKKRKRKIRESIIWWSHEYLRFCQPNLGINKHLV